MDIYVQKNDAKSQLLQFAGYNHDLQEYLIANFVLTVAFVGVSHRHLSDHLSELIETVLDDLHQSKVIIYKMHLKLTLVTHVKMLIL